MRICCCWTKVSSFWEVLRRIYYAASLKLELWNLSQTPKIKRQALHRFLAMVALIEYFQTQQRLLQHPPGQLGAQRKVQAETECHSVWGAKLHCSVTCTQGDMITHLYLWITTTSLFIIFEFCELFSTFLLFCVCVMEERYVYQHAKTCIWRSGENCGTPFQFQGSS